jgi:hypothetical protein
MSANEEASKRISDQIIWYDKKSKDNKNLFHLFKLLEILLAASIPVLSRFNITFVLAIIGASIVVLESIQGLFKFHENWILYRSTAESLKHENHLFEALAGPYYEVDNPGKVLAERTEGLVSQEHAKWTGSHTEHKKT